MTASCEVTERDPSRLTRRSLIKAVSAFGCLGCFPAILSAGALRHELAATEVHTDTYVVFGETENFNMRNGGNIVNTAFVDTSEGVVLIDTGPSFRYAEQLGALIETTTGKPVVRVYMTHHHPDHMLGNQVFEPKIIAAMPQMIANMAAEADGFSDNMYRLVGDWMRGTEIVLPQTTITGDNETVGDHTFKFTALAGHTSSDLIIQDESTGIVFGGDIAFYNRAPTTPHADIAVWMDALNQVERMNQSMLVSGHGPVDTDGQAAVQTREYLAWLQDTLKTSIDQGLSMTEVMALPIDPAFTNLAVVKEEFERSVAHLYTELEDNLLPVIPLVQ